MNRFRNDRARLSHNGVIAGGTREKIGSLSLFTSFAQGLDRRRLVVMDTSVDASVSCGVSRETVVRFQGAPSSTIEPLRLVHALPVQSW